MRTEVVYANHFGIDDVFCDRLDTCMTKYRRCRMVTDNGSVFLSDVHFVYVNL